MRRHWGAVDVAGDSAPLAFEGSLVSSVAQPPNSSRSVNFQSRESGILFLPLRQTSHPGHATCLLMIPLPLFLPPRALGLQVCL